MNELSQSGRFSENLSLNDAAGAAPNASVTDDLNSGKKAIPSEGKSVVNSIGIENVDLSFLIGKHTDYCYKMDTILKYLDLKSTTVNSSIHGVGYGVAKNPMHESDSNAVDV